MIIDFFSNMTSVVTGDGKKKKDISVIDFISRFKDAAWYTMKYFVGATAPDFYNDLGTLKGLPFSSYNKEMWD